jgi:ferredoxin-NADP reductase
MQELELIVASTRSEAEGIVSLELRSADAQPLPLFTAGAHIDLKLSVDLIRSYSLSNDPAERDRYVLAVNNEPNGRGGSRHIHEKLRPGHRVKSSAPRNLFELNEHAPHSVLIGGGIGITPLKSMVARLRTIGASWKLLYCTRSRETTAFLYELEQIAKEQPERIKLHFDDEAGRRPDLRTLVEDEPKESHFYCCGPLPMLAAFKEAASSIPQDRLHTEYFAANKCASEDSHFKVVLHRSKKEIDLLPGQSILDALLAADVAVPFSCSEGICGSCEVKVLEGIPDHRDQVLCASDRATNERMLVCCSRSKSAVLVLDL